MMFRLNDDFRLYLKYVMDSLWRKSDEIRNSLINSYGINISYYSSIYIIYDCKNFLNILREKNTILNNIKYNKENQIVDIIKKCGENIKQFKSKNKKKFFV